MLVRSLAKHRPALHKKEEQDDPPAVARPSQMQRSLSVGLLGAPSVGKSTLLNALCRSKVSITSSKAQTTRREVLAVLTDQRTNTQLSFFDTPGVLSPEDGAGNARRRQPRELATAALDVAGRVDALLLVLDASRPLERQPNALYALETLGARRLLPDVGMRALVVNKLDLARDAAAGAARAAILEADLAARGWEFGATFPTIALGGGFSLDERGGQGPAQDRSGVGTLRRWLLSAAVEGEWEHPPHFTGDCAEDPRLWARELTRERYIRSPCAADPFSNLCCSCCSKSGCSAT